MLANRLKECLKEVISENQSPFVQGRLITDNIIIANELTHYMKGLRRGSQGYATLKLDIAKAYDSLEWDYLEAMMFALGFSSRWIQRVMICVRSVTYNISIGGNLVGPIKPSRGLRQGDPLSPYLFIIAAEGLSASIRKRETMGLIHGCRIASNAPPISHLFFADDSYLFFKASSREGEEIKNLLELYKRASGQEVNFHKSSIFFSKNVEHLLRSTLCGLFNVKEDQGQSKYLGMPLLVGRRKAAVFGFIKEKLQSRVTAWKGSKLSRAGKEVLLKTVAQALPTYIMSLYLLPKSICLELEKMMNNFYWNGVKWMRWNKLCRARQDGGLGFKNLLDFNLAMLAKQGWRLMTEPHCLMARVLRSRYFAESNFLNAELGRNPSLIWQSIWKARDVLLKGCRVKVGDGLEINVWTAPWLPCSENGRVSTPIRHDLRDLLVADLICSGTKVWDVAKINSIFNERDAQLIRSIPLSFRRIFDGWFWFPDKFGVYTVKSGYQLLQSGVELVATSMIHKSLCNKIWTIKALPKMVNVLWRMVSNCIPTKVRLRQRHIPIDDRCPVCTSGEETMLHVFTQCHFAQECWRVSGIGCFMGVVDNVHAWLDILFSQVNKERWGLIAAVCWGIWKNRNDLLWNQQRTIARQIVLEASNSLRAWEHLQVFRSSLMTGGLQRSCPDRWAKPEEGWTKINVDAAVFADSGACSAVFRDFLGRFTDAFVYKHYYITDPCLLEIMAIREALTWIKARRRSKFQVESDCLIAVNRINSHSNMCSALGEIVQDCQRLLATLEDVRVVYIRRTANVAAHLLAKAAHSYSGLHVWGLSPPECICSALAVDLS